jgi:hypothetical protein
MFYPAVGEMQGGYGWGEDLEAEELADVLRSAMREEYADSSDEAMGDALGNILDSMTPAEEFNFMSALNQIGNSASRLASDPTFVQVMRTAAPIAGGALGTAIGGPLGTALGSQLGTLAASALPARPPVAVAPAVPPPVAAAPPPVAVAPAVPPPAAAVPPPAAAAPPPAAAAPRPVAATSAAAEPAPSSAPPPAVAPTAAAQPAAIALASGAEAMPAPEVLSVSKPASPVAGGSAAAAQALVLCQHGDVLQGLLAAALGLGGCQQVSGVPVAQLLNLFSEVLGQAAADADELLYLRQQANAPETVLEDAPEDSVRLLYTDLIGADNLELAEAAEWDGLYR